MTPHPILSREQVREVDRWAIEEIGLPGLVLMENAGRQVADAACEMLAGPSAPAVAVLAGAGNNGGDGFVAARHLRLRGIRADVYLLASREKIAGDARVNLNALERLGDKAVDCLGRPKDRLAQTWGGYGLLIDALGGTGIRGALRGGLAEAAEAANAAGAAILAVDIPTGLDCDSGRAEGPAIRARLTVTFVARKKGFDEPASAAFTGEVRVADIGVPLDRFPGAAS